MSSTPCHFVIDRCSTIVFQSAYPYRYLAFDPVKIMRYSNQQYPWRPQSFISTCMNTIVKYLCKNLAKYLPSFTEVKLLDFCLNMDFYITVQFKPLGTLRPLYRTGVSLSLENSLYIFNQQLYFIILYLLDPASLI